MAGEVCYLDPTRFSRFSISTALCASTCPVSPEKNLENETEIAKHRRICQSIRRNTSKTREKASLFPLR